MRIGLVGCGKICGAYLETLRLFLSVETVMCADLDAARARATAEVFAIPRVGSAEDVIGAASRVERPRPIFETEVERWRSAH